MKLTLEPNTAANVRVDARHFTSIGTGWLLDATHLAFMPDQLLLMLILNASGHKKKVCSRSSTPLD